MLKQFFKPKWQHQDENVRLNALATLNSVNNAEIINQLVLDDPSQKVRQAALEKVSGYSALTAILNNTESVKIWCDIATKIYRLVDSSEKNDGLKYLENSFTKPSNHWTEQELVSAVAASSLLPMATALLLNNADDERLFYIANSAKLIELRLLAVDALSDLSVLQRLSKKASNKQVVHAVRNRINQAKALQKEVNDNQSQAQKLVVAMEKLSNQAWVDDQLANKVERLNNKWNQLQQDYIKDYEQQFKSAQQQCNQQISERLEQANVAALIKEANSKQQGFCAKTKELITEFEQTDILAQSSFDALKDAFAFLQKSWQQLGEDYPPAKSLSNSFQESSTQLSRYFSYWDKFGQSESELLALFSHLPKSALSPQKEWLSQWNKLEKQLGWPQKMAMPQLLADWTKQAELINQDYKTLVNSQKKKLKYLNGKLALLDKHLTEKNLIAANKLSNYVVIKIEQLSNDFKTGVARKFESMQPRLAELRDWHAFATTPKKQQLCQQMSALCNSDYSPLEQAKAVRLLQNEWKELRASDSDADQQLWDQFKQASDTAYQPCLAYYAEQDKIKANNLSSRMSICSSLEQFINETNWDSPDWKHIDNLLAENTRNWHKYQPVPENEKRLCDEQFNQLSNTIRQRLNQQKQLNLDARCSLVAKANELNNSEELDVAIESAIKLQKQWKQVGMTFYKADREQWKLFRTALDKLFNKRNDQRQAFLSSLQDNQQKLENLTKAINELCALDDDSLKENHEKYRQLKLSWNADDKLPKAKASKILASFHNACERFENHFAGLGERQRVRQLKSLINGIDQLADAEEMRIEGIEFDQNKLIESITACPCDSVGKNLLKQRLNRLLDSTTAEINQSGIGEVERLALEGEILAGIDSPEKYKEARMELQLKSLQQGLGKISIGNTNEQLGKIIQSWMSIGFIPKEQRLLLDVRRNTLISLLTK